MLLNIYLGTTAISWATIFIFDAACKKNLERKGYEFIKEEKSIFETIASFVSTAFIGSIPIYNILNAIVLLCEGDELYDSMEEKLLEKDKIYIPIEKMSSNEDETSSREEIKAYTKNIKKEVTEKKYNEMTTEEKLAFLNQERENLINQSIVQNEQSSMLKKRR